MVHEHWDGCARPRNVDYATRRVGDHEPYPSHGSGSPGGVYRGHRGRLEVRLRSWLSVDYYGGERVNYDILTCKEDILRGPTGDGGRRERQRANGRDRAQTCDCS